MTAAARPLGVYVHWPYCARICPYCDFNVYKDREVDAGRWAAALSEDLASSAKQTPGRKLASLYFGGGTPSLAPQTVIERVIVTCKELWGFEPDAEITLEANPVDAETARFADLAMLGINRASLGVQSLDDTTLKFLGRNHNATSARRAIDTARRAFQRINLDFIYALPEESADDWRARLDDILSLGADHLSLYQLTVEPGTAFERAVARGAWTPPEDGLGADLFDIAQEMTANAGLPAYEVSNHAAPENASRHNLIYWRGHDYIGVGPGAHGRLTLSDGTRIATEAHKVPEVYLSTLEKGVGGGVREALSEYGALAERLSMGLRLAEGTPLYADDYFYKDDGRAARLQDMIDEGLLTLSCGALRATPQGRRVLNSVIGYLLT
ncbi:MAG: radical SAM family heme chaperone HemW [Pseudomonadota bacterium]